MTLVNYILSSKKLKKCDFKEEPQRGYQLKNKPKQVADKKSANERLREIFLIVQELANSKQENGTRAIIKRTELKFATTRRYLDELRNKGYVKKVGSRKYEVVREYLL